MKRFVLTSALLLALAAGAGYGTMAAAEPAGPPGPPPAGPPGHPPGPWAAWGRGPGPGHGMGPGGWQHRMEDFALFAHVQDKKLTSADVKVIASAILLEHGNHDWTVTNVAAQPDKSIDFSYATPHGDIIATFALDPVTGRMKRLS